MAEVIYITNVSLDGYIEDANGDFGFAEPSDEYCAFITDLIRPVGTYLYGRRLYEAMSLWETDPSLAAYSDLRAEFARAWSSAEKIVHSSSLVAPLTERTRIERDFDPARVRAVKENASATLTVGGAQFAAELFAEGLVDECHLFVAPVLVGGGKPGLPSGGRIDLELLDERRFENGIVYLRHRVRR